MDEPPLEISCQQVEQQLQDGKQFLLLDCREEEEHALVALRDAQLLPMSQLQQRVNELADHKKKPVVVFCHHGMRSAQVAAWLRQQGFPLAQSLSGGIDRWAIEVEPGMVRY